MRNPLWSLRKRLARRAPFPQVLEHDGGTFLLDPRNWIDNRLVAGVPYETQQIAMARRLIGERRIDTLIDVGANFGLYTVLLGRDPHVREIHAFEPVRRNFNQLCGNVFANRLDPKASLHRLALGETIGEAEIHVDPHSTGVSRLDLGSTDRDASVFTSSERIAVMRGDDVLALTGRAIFMKLDVEGHAPAALRGMTRVLATNHGAIQVEISPQEESVRSLLTQAGWSHAGAVASDHYFVRDQDASAS